MKIVIEITTDSGMDRELADMAMNQLHDLTDRFPGTGVSVSWGARS